MPMLLNVRKVKGIVWALVIFTIAGILFVLVDIIKKDRRGDFKSKQTRVFQAKLMSGYSDERGTATKAKNINDYYALWKNRIDGSRRKDPNEEAANQKKEEIPKNEPISNVLEVSMVLHSPGAPEESLVRILYTNDQPEEKSLTRHLWCKEGDPLNSPYDKAPRSGKIVRIEEDQVVFSWFGEETALGPKSFVSSADKVLARAQGKEGFPEDPASKYRNKPPEETVEFKPGHYALSEKEYKDYTQNYESILGDVSLSTYRNPETGKESIKLGEVKENSIVHQRGARMGDILISINGIPVSSKAAAINYFKKNPDLGAYTVEIERQGRRIFKTFYYDN